jgi:hypothetical protein
VLHDRMAHSYKMAHDRMLETECRISVKTTYNAMCLGCHIVLESSIVLGCRIAPEGGLQEPPEVAPEILILDPTVWLGGARPASTCVPPSFPWIRH